jgi:hypothetical protein
VKEVRASKNYSDFPCVAAPIESSAFLNGQESTPRTFALLAPRFLKNSRRRFEGAEQCGRQAGLDLARFVGADESCDIDVCPYVAFQHHAGSVPPSI